MAFCASVIKPVSVELPGLPGHVAQSGFTAAVTGSAQRRLRSIQSLTLYAKGLRNYGVRTRLNAAYRVSAASFHSVASSEGICDRPLIYPDFVIHKQHRSEKKKTHLFRYLTRVPGFFDIRSSCRDKPLREIINRAVIAGEVCSAALINYCAVLHPGEGETGGGGGGAQVSSKQNEAPLRWEKCRDSMTSLSWVTGHTAEL